MNNCFLLVLEALGTRYVRWDMVLSLQDEYTYERKYGQHKTNTIHLQFLGGKRSNKFSKKLQFSCL